MKLVRFLPLLLAGLVIGSQTTAQPTPAQLDHLAALVEADKLEEAKIRTETLLEIFPDDPALTEIQRLLLARSATLPKPKPETPTPARPPVPEVLDWEDQNEIDTATREAEAALEIHDPAQRKEALRDLLDYPIPPRAKTSAAWAPYWKARAIAALQTDDIVNGCRSAKALAKLDSLLEPDPQRSELLDLLKQKGWLDADFAAKVDVIATEHAPWLGTWGGKGRQEGVKTNASITVRISLSPDLKVVVRCAGETETDPRATDVNWMIIKEAFALPGRFAVEAWIGAPANYDLSNAKHVSPDEYGTFQSLGHDFSDGRRELTLRYRYNAKKGAIKDSESALILRLAESGESLVMKQGLNIPTISPYFIKTLSRPKR